MTAEAHGSIRPLVAGDAADVERIGAGRALWRDWLTGGLPSADGQERLARLDARGAMVGLSWCNAAGDWLDLCDVVVVPPARRQGHARALVRHAQRAAGARGAAGVTLEVAVDNAAARALYEELGFTEVHRRPAYYAATPRAVDAAIMSWRCPR